MKNQQQNINQIKEYNNQIFLTKADKLNRKRGYNLYVPDTYEKFQLYWELSYGIILPIEIPFITSQVPIVLMNILIDNVEQIVPMQSLVRYKLIINIYFNTNILLL